MSDHHKPGRPKPRVPLLAQRPWQAWLDRLAFGMLLLAVAWAPWPLASERPWSFALLAMWVWLAVLLGLLGWAADRSGRLTSHHDSRLTWLPPLALAGFAAVQVWQLMPGSGTDGQALSASPYHTRLYLLCTLLYGGMWLLVLRTVRDRRRAQMALATVVAAAVAQAVLAVVLLAGREPYMYMLAWFPRDGRATGTFANTDHLASAMHLGIAAAVGWLLTQLSARGALALDAARGASTWKSLLQFTLSPKMLLRLLMIVMVIALVLTRSRMGNGAFLLGIVVLGGLLAWRSQQLRRATLWLVGSMLVIDILIIGQWVGLEKVVQRIRDTEVTEEAAQASIDEAKRLQLRQKRREESVEERLQAPFQALALAKEKPVFGHGAGTFTWVFPAYKDPETPEWFVDAHNDYVQVAADTGLVGLALWLVPGLLTLGRAIRLMADEHGGLHRGIGAAGALALLCVGMHAMVDFTLHIPANALTLSTLLALVWAAGLPRSAAAAKPSRSNGGAHG